MRILVVQTTRMGDVLQTSPLIHALRVRHPKAHIAVMVRRMGKTIAERHPDVNEVIVYDEDTLFLDLQSGDSDRLLRAYETAESRIASLKSGNFNIAYNVTHSIASAMLLKLAEIPEVVGAHLSDDWQFLLRGRWPAYFFTSVFSRDYNDLNLCDITGRFEASAAPSRELHLCLTDEDRTTAHQLLAVHGIGENDFVACLQLGASEENKRWTEQRFAELARLLADRFQARIVLVGIAEEAPLGESFQRHASVKALPLFGKTSIPQLAALLERANVLVTNDTGTMHIAAAAGCPVALVSVGHVHYRETGPYGAGHCAVEWRRESLGRSDVLADAAGNRDKITAEQALCAVELAVSGKENSGITQIEDSPDLADVDLYVTGFAPDGCLQFYPAICREMLERDFLRIAYRAMWIAYLGGQTNPELEKDCLLAMLRHFSGPDAATLAQWSVDSGSAFGELAAMAATGIELTNALVASLDRGGSLVQAKQQVAELMALDERARVFAEVHPPCRPLILMARFERDNLEGADPLRLARETRTIYDACRTRAMLVQEKLERTARLAEELV